MFGAYNFGLKQYYVLLFSPLQNDKWITTLSIKEVILKVQMNSHWSLPSNNVNVMKLKC